MNRRAGSWFGTIASVLAFASAIAVTSCVLGSTQECRATIDNITQQLETTIDDNIRAHQTYSVAMRAAAQEFRRVSSLAYSLDLVSIAADADEFAREFETIAAEADVAVIDIIESRQEVRDYVTEDADWEFVASLMGNAADATQDRAEDATFVATILDRQTTFALEEGLPSWAADPVVTSRLTQASVDIRTVAGGFRSIASLAAEADETC